MPRPHPGHGSFLALVLVVLVPLACATNGDRSVFPTDAASAAAAARSMVPSASALGSVAAVSGCPSRPADILLQVVDVFPQQQWVSVFGQLEQLAQALVHRNLPQARTIMFQLWKYTLGQYTAGTLENAGGTDGKEDVIELGRALYCLVGLSPTGLTVDALGPGNVIAVLTPADTTQTVATGDGNAGLQVPGKTLTSPVTITISLIATTFPPFQGPLNTQLDQYGPFYQFDVVPAVQFSQDVTISQCLQGIGPTSLVPSSVKIAHNVGTGIQILALTPSFLNCGATGSARLGPSAAELAQRGHIGRALVRLGRDVVDFVTPTPAYAATLTGIGGKTKSFSPFGGVDTTGIHVIRYGAAGYKFLLATTAAPGDTAGFAQPSFNDGTWTLGTAAFGSGSVGGTVCPLDASVQTHWDNSIEPSILLLRHPFTLPAGLAGGLEIGVAIDNDIQLYVNGTDVTSTVQGATVNADGFVDHEGCATLDSFLFEVPANLLVLGGSNELAVRARDRGLVSLVDVRVTAPNTAPSSATAAAATVRIR